MGSASVEVRSFNIDIGERLHKSPRSLTVNCLNQAHPVLHPCRPPSSRQPSLLAVPGRFHGNTKEIHYILKARLTHCWRFCFVVDDGHVSILQALIVR